MAKLAEHKVRTILDYSAEGQTEEADLDALLAEIKRREGMPPITITCLLPEEASQEERQITVRGYETVGFSVSRELGAWSVEKGILHESASGGPGDDTVGGARHRDRCCGERLRSAICDRRSGGRDGCGEPSCGGFEV